MRTSHAVVTIAILLLLAAAGAEAAPPETGAAPPPKLPSMKPVEFGSPFPTGVYPNLNAGPGGMEKIDLKDVVGKIPVVFCYFIAGEARSESVFQEVQALVESLGRQKVVLYGITTPTGAMDVQKLRERLRELKVQVPVLHDEGPRLGFQLGVLRVPAIAILDREGRLRLANGGSLKQTLEYKLDLGDAVRRVAETGQLGTYGMLPMYYPAVEMTGKKCPDFEAPLVGAGGDRSLASLFASDKINVLIFWAQDCPHCRKSLPAIETWYSAHPDGFNILTAAKVSNDATRIKTEEFLKEQHITLPTFIDQDLKVGQQYLVSSTPTIFVVRPDGVIDSVLLSGEMDYGAAFEASRKRLLQR
jgi:thiol-disulfide isomerase/thioredoxin